MKTLNLNDIKELALQKNVECLEDAYINSKTSMRWKCLNEDCKYEWSTRIHNFYKSKGCTRCNKGRGKPYTYDEVQTLVNKRGFKLLDTEYVRSSIPLNFQCLTCDYKWKASFGNITRSEDKTCPACKNRRSHYKIEEVHEICEKKNLKCLESEYKHGNEKMRFQCMKCNREWSTVFRSILQNKRCIKCTFKEKICLSMEDIYENIKDRDIKCLDTEYINNNTYMNWKCLICSNTWKAKFHHIKDSNSGCPNCSSWRSEKLCRNIFQSSLGVNFPSSFPRWLQGLQLDGYNEELKLAFEYHGIQHFEYTPNFHRNGEEDFYKQQGRDELKKKLCEENGVI